MTEAERFLGKSLMVYVRAALEAVPKGKTPSDGMIERMLASAFVSGVTTATGLLHATDGSLAFTPAAMEKAALVIAQKLGADVRAISL